MPDVITTIVNLLVILTILVVAHELGHFSAAKLFRMRVEDFSVFFGPVLWQIGKRGDTVYNIRAIPFGGFVKIAGLDPEDISNGRPILQAIRNPTASGGTDMDKVLRDLDADIMADIKPEAISQSIREMIQTSIGADGQLTESGRADLQAQLSSPRITQDEHKLITIVLNADRRSADPHLVNNKPIYQRAIVFFAGPLASMLFAYVLFCGMGMTVGMPSGETTNQVAEVSAGGAASKAGMIIGDRIVKINGQPTPTGRSMVETIHQNAGHQLILTVVREGKTLTIPVTPRTSQIEGKTVGLIGVMPNMTFERLGFRQSMRAGTMTTYGYVVNLVRILVVERKVRENLGGPLAMGQMTAAVERLGIAHVVLLAASLSLSLGIMNLLPIPILDGGHLMILGVEKIRRRRFSPREWYHAQMIGLGILVLLICFVMFNDIARTVAGHAIR